MVLEIGVSQYSDSAVLARFPDVEWDGGAE
jgi:hypothetical protein